MKTITATRRRGGVSRSIDYLRTSLIDPDPADEAANPELSSNSFMGSRSCV
jgi:hypothetical protein